MAQRHENALEAIATQAPLKNVLGSLVLAIDETEASGARAETDPAVMLLGVQVAFLLHADHALTWGLVPELINACRMNAKTCDLHQTMH